jgi:hypothetical protein
MYLTCRYNDWTALEFAILSHEAFYNTLARSLDSPDEPLEDRVEGFLGLKSGQVYCVRSFEELKGCTKIMVPSCYSFSRLLDVTKASLEKAFKDLAKDFRHGKEDGFFQPDHMGRQLCLRTGLSMPFGPLNMPSYFQPGMIPTTWREIQRTSDAEIQKHIEGEERVKNAKVGETLEFLLRTDSSEHLNLVRKVAVTKKAAASGRGRNRQPAQFTYEPPIAAIIERFREFHPVNIGIQSYIPNARTIRFVVARNRDPDNRSSVKVLGRFRYESEPNFDLEDPMSVVKVVPCDKMDHEVQQAREMLQAVASMPWLALHNALAQGMRVDFIHVPDDGFIYFTGFGVLPLDRMYMNQLSPTSRNLLAWL